MDIKKKINSLPLGSGVYIMKSLKGEVLYVGKASSLKKRVKSYFSRQHSLKTDILLKNIADIDYIECDAPEQALILEAALIKEKKPKYNIVLKDNKTYPYVEITKEKFPRIFISRPKKKSKGIFFGPYPKTKTLKSALMRIRKIFPYRSCRNLPKKSCLFFDLKLCPAPCIGNISFVEYKAIIENICKILKGERKRLGKNLKSKMNKLAADFKFEEAALMRDRMVAVESIYEGKPKTHEIISLKETLKLDRLPLTIEAVDISSLGNYSATGSVVVFREGVADKSSYRRFLIKEVKVRDDYAMIGEVVRRRYSRLTREDKKLPDLLIIDGGKGHVLRAQNELILLGVAIPIIGIAKKNEEIWFPNKKNALCIPKNDPCLHLIQRVRDEAHRFAHKYQVSRRKKIYD